MLAHEGGWLEGEAGVGLGEGGETGVVDAAELVRGVEVGSGGEDLAVVCGGGSDDHLGGLAGGGESWCFAGTLAVLVGLVLTGGDLGHGGLDDGGPFLGGELDEVSLGGEFDIGGEAVGEEAGLIDEQLRRAGDGLEVDVTAELVDLAKLARDGDELLHGVVGRLDDAGGEEEAFDVVALVEVEGEVDDFFGGEAGALDVGRDAVDAEDAIVGADVGEEDFEERDAASVGGIGVADAHAVGVADALPVAAALGAAAGAGGVVLGGVGENFEFLLGVHGGWMSSCRIQTLF